MHKLDEHVAFPSILDLTPFVTPAEPAEHYTQLRAATSGAAPAAQLRLYALIEHQGTFAGGHYIAYVRLGTSWFRMSDSVVVPVDEEAVLQKQAFLLFYERCSMVRR